MDRICIIGDSITHGTGDESMLGWPGIVFKDYPKLTIYNLGVRADTSELIATRWKSESKVRLPDKQRCGLIFSFGTNDSADKIGEGIRVKLEDSVVNARKILKEAKAWLPTIMIGPIPIVNFMQPFNSGAGIYHFDNERIASYNNAYKALAIEIQIPYLDIYSFLSTNERWSDSQKSNDGIHPMHKGYQALATYINSWDSFQKFIHDV